MSIVCRYDAATLGQAKRTPQGFLRAAARLTRTGVLAYKRADGTVCRELRRPEQVFAAESLATLGDAPLTDLHPREMVTPDNARALSVGHVSHATSRADGKFVEADVVVTDAKMIAAIEAGTRREVSCGYKCKLIVGGGTWNGEHYDAEQTEIVYNHAGLGPPKWGRAGSEVALRLDGGEAEFFALTGDDALVLDADDGRQLPPPKDKDMELVTLRVDGIDCQVPKDWAQVITKGIETRDAAVATAKQDAAAHKARLDALQGELDGTKAKLEAAADPKRFDAAVTERIGLIERAHQVLGTETKLDGLTTRAIKELVVKKLDPKADFAGKSDEYVQGRFDSADPSAQHTDFSGLKPIKKARADGGDPPKYPTPPWLKPLASTRSS